MKADTDGDRLPDRWKIDNGTKPLADDAAPDPATDCLNGNSDQAQFEAQATTDLGSNERIELRELQALGSESARFLRGAVRVRQAPAP